MSPNSSPDLNSTLKAPKTPLTTLILLTILACLSLSGCANLPLYNHVRPHIHNHPYDNSHLRSLSVHSNIALAKWYLQEAVLLSAVHELNSPGKTSTKKRTSRIKRNLKRQQQVATVLIDQCEQLNPEMAFFLVSECAQLLTQLPLSQQSRITLSMLSQRVESIKTELSSSIDKIQKYQAKRQQGAQTSSFSQSYALEHFQPSQINTMIKSLADTLQKGDLLAAKLVLQVLSQQSNVTPRQMKQIQQQTTHFNQKIHALDQYADQLYQQKFISEAQAIWSLLLKLTTNPQIINKHDRSKKVLENLHELRQDGHVSPHPKTPFEPSTQPLSQPSSK